MKNFLKIAVALLVAAGIYAFAFYKTPQQRTFAKTLTQAQAGDVPSAVKTGDFYAQGLGVEPNGAQAAEWYRKAAAQGDTGAAWKLAQLYIQGTLVKQDYEEALPFLQLAAQAGNVAAQTELARFYSEGLGGLSASKGDSILWNLKASAMGSPEAQETLRAQREADPDFYDVVNRFSATLLLAAQGDSQAKLSAGEGYRMGYPVTKNDEEALRYFTLAWQEGQLSAAAFELSEMYQKGEGTEKDENKALELLGAAAQAKNPSAQYALGERAYKAEPANYQDAFAWFSNAAEGGLAQAQYMTGFMLMQGQGTERSVPLAIEFFKKAATQNDTAAQYVLGQIYWKGLGVPKDKKEGRAWLEKAAAGGNLAARELLNQ
ncbi:tetratricopeptide repeat protein [Candidatus Avelusimicrobium sp.]|uniref:tetratricopeptide repeat protein n=1 Tax=Candidatus Avelusimicrobium sp. TaxID=3048833 RepID=UPI003D7EE616